MCLPALVDLCRKADVELIAGAYALPVWQWAKEHVIGADYKITRVIEDPDAPGHPFEPALGFPAIDKAAEMIRNERPGVTVLSYREIGNAYAYGGVYPPLKLKDLEVKDGDTVVIHPFTRHIWKNCMMTIRSLDFAKPVQVVGLPGEWVEQRWKQLSGFDTMARAVLHCAGFVGVLSSWTNFAALFEKRQVIVSYTPEVPIRNPRARVLVNPSIPELQSVCTEMGL